VTTACALVVAAFGLAATSGISSCRRPPNTGVGTHADAGVATDRPARYSALGAGHLLRDVSSDGRFITLEDGSRWEVIPRDQFTSVEWQPPAAMAVRTTRGEDGFDYEVVNTNDDEGVLAKFLPKQ
jgi:hypothetical protein